jgi:hypothetical protein
MYFAEDSTGTGNNHRFFKYETPFQETAGPCSGPPQHSKKNKLFRGTVPLRVKRKNNSIMKQALRIDK